MGETSNKIKVIFIGTPEFGAPTLEALINDKRFEIAAVITQPDMPVGREKILTAPPIKILGQKYNLSVLQPQKIQDIANEIKKLEPDIIAVIAYAQIIPEEILNLPKFGCLNLHGSLLPKYRGAAVIQAAILNNDKQTGLTVIKMDKDIDTGPILAQVALPITANDNYGSLYDKLAELAPSFFINTLIKYLSNEITPRAQQITQGNYVGQLKKSDGLINWSKSAEEIARFIRAMTPWPSAWTWWNGKQLKITAAQNKTIEINTYKSGKTFIYNSGLAVQCGQDALIIKKLQLEGKKELTSEEFIRGRQNFVGSILG